MNENKILISDILSYIKEHKHISKISVDNFISFLKEKYNMEKIYNIKIINASLIYYDYNKQQLILNIYILELNNNIESTLCIENISKSKDEYIIPLIPKGKI